MVILLSIQVSSPSNGTETTNRTLILIDTSKSMGLPATQGFPELLQQPAFNDDVARRITMIHYPTSLGPRLTTFQNSSEFQSTLKQFVPSQGRANLTSVFDLSRNWGLISDYENRNVVWIADGGGLNAVSANISIASLMEQIAPLENWHIFDFSEDSSMKGIGGIVGEYRDFDSQLIKSISPIDFSKMTNFSISENAELEPKIDLRQPFPIIIAVISAMVTFYLFWVLYLALSKAYMRRRRFEALGGKLVFDDAQERDTFGILWNLIPQIWKSPIVEYLEAGYDKQSTRKKLLTSLLYLFTISIIFSLVFGNVIASFIISLFVIPIIFKILYRIRSRKYDKAFEKALPGILMLTSSGLRSGLSLENGLDAYTYDNQSIASKEIRRVLGEVRLGSTTEVALADLAVRRNCEDLKWVVTALSIQRSVGGSLSTIIDTVIETIGERAALRREIRTLSAEGRLSAYVLVALPLFLFLFLYATRRDYVSVYWTDPLGILMMIVILALISVGWFWMKKVVNIKV